MQKTANEYISYCAHCQEYAIGNTCATCEAKTINIRPPKYSPEDRYGTYRRQMKRDSDANTY